jgi:hypothetical protein
MDRAEALNVLHELLEECKESVIMNIVSLDNTPISPTSKGYQIKISCALDGASKKCIEPILKKHKLLLEESGGFVIIKTEV